PFGAPAAGGIKGRASPCGIPDPDGKHQSRPRKMRVRRVRTKFASRIRRRVTTTAVVVARPTPSAPPVVLKPKKHPTSAMMLPKKIVLNKPEYTSRRYA